MAAYDMDLAATMTEARRPSLNTSPLNEKDTAAEHVQSGITEFEPEPTMEELKTLRRVSGKIPWQAYTVTFVEFCERFSWYGTTQVFVNFIQQPLPPGSTTGAIVQTQECYDQYGEAVCTLPGALGQSQTASTGLTTFFFAYTMPMLGGWIADEYLGRYATIQYSIIFAVIGHILLIVSSVPSVITNSSGALGCFAVGIVIMGIGTGGFKANLAPLLGEQLRDKRPRVVTLASGERVIRDPAVTLSRMFLYYYLMINIGGLAGGIGMVYAERYIGFWLAYALPLWLFLFAPAVLILCKKRYHRSPPTGSVVARAFKLFALGARGRWSLNPIRTFKNFREGDFWGAIKPSRLGDAAPAWMVDIDDQWVDQVARGLKACKVFLWLPLYWLAYNQMVNNLISQAATMELNGVPNDLLNNLNPLSLVIFIPIFDGFIYPAIRKAGFHFTPIKRITWGFGIASAAMISATIIQYYIYKESPCPDSEVSESANCQAPINVWVQTVPYALIGFSEIFASITSLEYAVSKAPENMRGLVMGVNLLQTAFASAIGQALLPLASDPLLIWNYGVVAVLAAVGGLGFWFTFRELDSREDELNLIEATKYKGREGGRLDSIAGTITGRRSSQAGSRRGSAAGQTADAEKL